MNEAPPIQRGNDYFVGDVIPDVTEGLPRVTTILNEVAKQQFLSPWMAKLAAEYAFANPSSSLDEAKGAATRYTDKAAAKGSTVHSWCEAYANGASINIESMPKELKGYAISFINWVDEVKPEFLHTERIIANLTYGYAGTADIIAKVGGRTLIIDIKTGKNVYDWDYSLQCSAYLHGEVIIDPATREQFELPVIEDSAVLHLRPRGFAWHELPDTFESFVAYLHIFRARQGKPCPPVCCLCAGVAP